MTKDPDLVQAIEDLRPVYGELVAVARGMRKLDQSVDHKKIVAAKAQVADLRGRINTRAEKLALDSHALTMVLKLEFYERTRIRRKPSYDQMAKALRAERGFTSGRLSEAERDFEVAKEQLAKRQRDDRAARAAVLLYTGFER